MTFVGHAWLIEGEVILTVFLIHHTLDFDRFADQILVMSDLHFIKDCTKLGVISPSQITFFVLVQTKEC